MPALHGWRPPCPHTPGKYPQLPRMGGSWALPSLPESIDLSSMMPPVVDQKDVGDCTANAGCTVLEFCQQFAADFVAFVLMARLFVYFYTHKVEGTPTSEDSGAAVRDVFVALTEYGCCTEATWPYDPPSQRFMLQPSDPAIAEALQHKALLYYECPDLFTVKASLAQKRPVAFGFSVPDNMMTARCAETGIVYYPTISEGFQGGHAVVACGYDDKKQIGAETGAVLCQNSWGVDWGIAGRFWLPYRMFTDGLANDCWTLRREGV